MNGKIFKQTDTHPNGHTYTDTDSYNYMRMYGQTFKQIHIQMDRHIQTQRVVITCGCMDKYSDKQTETHQMDRHRQTQKFVITCRCMNKHSNKQTDTHPNG
jgi:hypothetical protein